MHVGPLHLAAALVASTLLALPAVAPAQQADRLPSVALPAPLDRVLRDYERAWKGNDAKALAALFTADGFVPDRTGWRRGTRAIAAKYAESGGDLRLRAHAWATADTVGYIVGAYGYGDEAATRDMGKFVLALRRAPGGPWRIAADLDNGNH